MKMLSLLTAALSIIMISSVVSADGCIFIPDYSEYVYSPSQKAAIVWDGTRETMILSVRMTMDEPESVAWVVPVPSKSKPEVTEGDEEVFFQISSLLTPPPDSKGMYPFPFMTGMTRDGFNQVTVVEEKKVDIYDIAILKATDPNVLVDWLNENGYNTPSEAVPVLEYYTDQEDFYFIANKVNVTNKYPGMAFSQNDKSCSDAFIRILNSYYLGGISAAEHFITREMNSGSRMNDEFVDAGCMNSSVEEVLILYQLKKGISTPLKFEFEPDSPFYPMKMTSINEGEVKVNVYVFSDTYLKDASGIMQTEKMTGANSAVRESLGLEGENFLTALTFEGGSSALTEDSYFEAAPYDPVKDPYYVSPAEMVLELLYAATMIAFIGFYLAVFIAVPTFLLGLLAAWCSGKMDKLIKKEMHKMINKIIVLIILFAAELLLISAMFRGLSFALLAFLIPIYGYNILGFFSYRWKGGARKWILSALGVTAIVLIMFFSFAWLG